MVLRAGLISFGWIALASALAFADGPRKPEPKDPKAKVYKGTLKHPVYAIGGETTGTVIETDSGTIELDLSRRPGLPERARSLANKPVVVTGTLTIRPGVEVKERRILEVTELKAADAGRPKGEPKGDRPKGTPKGRPRPVEVAGTLRHPVDTGRGEALGTLLETEAESYELDLSRRPGLPERARSLANKPVVVTGTLTVFAREGGEERRVIQVTALKADADE